MKKNKKNVWKKRVIEELNCWVNLVDKALAKPKKSQEKEKIKGGNKKEGKFRRTVHRSNNCLKEF